MADLDAFMAAHAALPWAWGSEDCSLILADWAVANGRPDPAASWRGAYSSELDWKAIVVARGGLLPLVSDVCARAGIPAAGAIARGVIGIIGSANYPDRQWAGIHDGQRWQVRGQGGFAQMTARALGTWSV